MKNPTKRIEALEVAITPVNPPPVRVVYCRRGELSDYDGEPITQEQYQELTRRFTVIRVDYVPGLKLAEVQSEPTT